MDDENENNVVPMIPNPGKPIIEMDAEERDHVFSSLTLDIHKGMLEGARRKEDQDLVAAVTVLRLANGEERVVSWASEYGDGDGRRSQEEIVTDCEKFGLLKAGESIEVRLSRVTAVDD